VSGWLHNLVVQSRGVDRAVRPAAAANRRPVFPPDAASEISHAVSAAAPEALVAPTRAQSDRQRKDRPGEADAGSMSLRGAPATPHQHDVGDREDRGLPPARSLPGHEPGAAGDVMEHDVRSSRSDEPPATAAARIQPPISGAPPVRPRVETTAVPIRPALPPRAAAPVPGAATVEQPAPVPDVHIHIGRIELTAVTAAAPRRERAAAPHKPMTLDEYLRRRNGGTR
jgi:hypothetical protein